MNNIQIEHRKLGFFLANIIIKRSKNSFEKELVDSILSIKGSIIVFSPDIKSVRSNWNICHSKNQTEALKSNKFLTDFLNDIERTFKHSQFTKNNFEEICFNF